MDTKALRQKILDLAIRGKLVPQNPDDEPASVLLEKIRDEKQKLVKEGKLKAKDIKNDTVIFRGEDNLHYEKFANGSVKCIEEEIPFEVPEGWAWCRLISLTIKIGAGSTPAGGASVYSTSGIKFIRSQNVYNNGLNLKDVAFISEFINNKKSGSIVQPKDILLNITGGSIGRCALVPDDFDIGNVNQHVMIIRLLETSIRNFIHSVLISPYIQEQILSRQVGSGRGGLSAETLSTFLFPIPPLNEQILINEALANCFSHIWAIANESSTVSELITKAKSKILDLAIRGKLVPQDPNDEPASVLLEHIRTEKEELIKQGKIKRDKKESIIFKGDDNSYYEKFENETIHCIDKEIPFDIPDSWSFEKIRNIFIVNPKNNLVDDTTVSFISMNMIDEQFSGKYQYEIKNWSVCKNGFTHFASNDVAFAKISPCFENRKSVLFEKLENDVGAGTTELYVIRRYINNILGKYILYFVKSEYFILRGKNTFSGVVGQQRVRSEERRVGKEC